MEIVKTSFSNNYLKKREFAKELVNKNIVAWAFSLSRILYYSLEKNIKLFSGNVEQIDKLTN